MLAMRQAIKAALAILRQEGTRSRKCALLRHAFCVTENSALLREPLELHDGKQQVYKPEAQSLSRVEDAHHASRGNKAREELFKASSALQNI